MNNRSQIHPAEPWLTAHTTHTARLFRRCSASIQRPKHSLDPHSLRASVTFFPPVKTMLMTWTTTTTRRRKKLDVTRGSFANHWEAIIVQKSLLTNCVLIGRAQFARRAPSPVETRDYDRRTDKRSRKSKTKISPWSDTYPHPRRTFPPFRSSGSPRRSTAENCLSRGASSG